MCRKKMNTNKISSSNEAVIVTAIICATAVIITAMAMVSGALDTWIQQAYSRRANRQLSQYAVQYEGQRVAVSPAAPHTLHRVISDAKGDVAVINEYVESRQHPQAATYGYSPYEAAMKRRRQELLYRELRTVALSGETVRDPKYLEYLALRADAYAYAERDLIRDRVSAAMAQAELDMSEY